MKRRIKEIQLLLLEFLSVCQVNFIEPSGQYSVFGMPLCFLLRDGATICFKNNPKHFFKLLVDEFFPKFLLLTMRASDV